MIGSAAVKPRARMRMGASDRALARIAVVAASLLSAVVWTRVVTQRWANFEASAFDLAFFDQVLWNTAHGRIFETTFVPYNFAGQHFEPVLLVFAAAYRFGAGPLFLTMTQAIAASGAALLLYEAARQFGLRPAIAAATAVTYLVSPYLHEALLFDFHPEVMVAAPAFGALWAIAAGRPRVGASLALSTLLFKEDALFVALALAVALALRGHRRHAIAVGIAAVVWSALVIGVVMPSLRDGHPNDLAARYTQVLGSRDGVAGLSWAATHPLNVLRVLSEGPRLESLGQFVASSAVLALAAPPWALLTLTPPLLVGVLSTHPPQQALELHYAAEAVPTAVIATLFGARRLASRWPARAIAAALILPACVGFVAWSPVSPLTERPSPPSAARRAAIHEAIALVPREASVSAQSVLLPRLSQRRNAYEFPRAARDAEWVVVDASGHRTSQSIDAGYDRALEAVRQHHELVFARDGVEVFRATAR